MIPNSFQVVLGQNLDNETMSSSGHRLRTGLDGLVVPPDVRPSGGVGLTSDA